jgi:hypothetical protein
VAWRHTNILYSPTGRRKKRLLVLQWIDEEMVSPEKLRVWEQEAKCSPYIASAFTNAGLTHEELKITGAACNASMHKNMDTVKLQVVDGAGYAGEPLPSYDHDSSKK